MLLTGAENVAALRKLPKFVHEPLKQWMELA
jgi:hypothetical protein